ncbi:uncharacterized protein LOC133289741 [Gastrolobium bilobum]|uniref:uncharacterized protein LOC133289741 n=1 Tax=Gastrolobium bilobum TaxID=150636 RepID=UPI002AB31BEF|nr:uncharacterized protein LOC133289741 [Gastrolobium bilobum]
MGDFNSILSVVEKTGGKKVCWRSLSDMQQCLWNCNLSDMGYKGPEFTWKRGRLHERLDRACSSEAWNIAWPDRFVSHLPFYNSDHRPILVCNGHAKNGAHPRSFKFLAAWLTDKSFNSLVKNSWENNVGWLMARHKFEEEAKRWHLDVFKEALKQKNRLYSRLNGLDSFRFGRFDPNTELLQKELWKELQGILIKEELIWFQRSRNQWLKYGDKNSKFFHSSTVSRRRHNRIVTLKNEQGKWVSDTKELVDMAVAYYQQLFKGEDEIEEVFPILNAFPNLRLEETRVLSAMPDKEEIRRTIFRMGKFMAPGPDGLNALFFHSQWNIIGDSVCKLIEEIFCCPDKVKEINGTLICLIPKKENP